MYQQRGNLPEARTFYRKDPKNMSNARLDDITQDVPLVILRYRITKDTYLFDLIYQIDNDLRVTPIADGIAPINEDEYDAPGLEFSSLDLGTGTVRVLNSDGDVMDSCSLPAVLHVPTWNPRNGSYLLN